MKDTAKGQVVAYERVSTEDQNHARQEDIAEGADRVFREKASGKDRNRPVLNEMIAYVREGDTVRVWSMDRLARNQIDLQMIVTELTGKGVTVEFHTERLTFAPGENDPIATLLMQLLGAVAQMERSNNRERQRQGIAKAKDRGVYTRDPLLSAEQARAARERVALGVPKTQVARDLGVGRTTLYRALERLEASA